MGRAAGRVLAVVVAVATVVGGLTPLVVVSPAVATPSGSQTFPPMTDANPASFVVPSGVSLLLVDAYGAQGSDAFGSSQHGGKGARIVVLVPVTAGETLQVFVGSRSGSVNGGRNGGGAGGSYSSDGGGGGGATDI